MNEKAVEYTDVLNARLNKVQQDFDQQLVSINRLATENTNKAAELKAKEDEINELRQERLHQSAIGEAIQKKLRDVEELKIEVEQREETLKGQVSGLKKGKGMVTNIDKVNYKLQLFPSIILLNKLSLLYD